MLICACWATIQLSLTSEKVWSSLFQMRIRELSLHRNGCARNLQNIGLYLLAHWMLVISYLKWAWPDFWAGQAQLKRCSVSIKRVWVEVANDSWNIAKLSRQSSSDASQSSSVPSQAPAATQPSAVYQMQWILALEWHFQASIVICHLNVDLCLSCYWCLQAA